VFGANDTIHAQWTAQNTNEVFTAANRPSDFAVPANTINAVNSNIPRQLLRIRATGSYTFNAGATVAGQQAVLVRYNTSTQRLEFVAGAKVNNSGNASWNITTAGDYVALVFKTGDVTGTGSVDTSDAMALLRHIAALSRLDAIQLYVANGREGEINTGDAMSILRLIAGLITEIP
jgi:hypothetical protein